MGQGCLKVTPFPYIKLVGVSKFEPYLSNNLFNEDFVK